MRIGKYIGGLAFALFAFLQVPAAMAQDDNPCVPTTDDSVSIGYSGDCTISGDIVATSGDVNISISGGTLTITGQVSAAGNVYLTGDGGVIINGTTTASGGVLTANSSGGTVEFDGAVTTASDSTLMAQSDVTVGSTFNSGGILAVTSTGGEIEFDDTATSANGASFAANNSVSLQDVDNTDYGDVRIFANQGGSGDVFEVGGSSDNSVASVTNSGSYATIYVTNLAPAGLSYNGSNLLDVTTSDGSPGAIILDGLDGQSPVMLSGTLNADGGSVGGSIDIFASEIDVTGDTTLSASAPGGTVGGMNLISNAENLNGSLTINLNGTSPSYVIFAMNPVDSYSISATPDLTQSISYGNYTGSAQPVDVSGEGNLTINSAGDNNNLKFWGYPLSLTSSAFTVNMSGQNDSITMDGWDGNQTDSPVNLAGNIQIHVNTNAAGQTPGSIEMSGTTIGPAPLSGNVLFDASGTSGGDGGAINFFPGSGESDFGGSGSYFTFNANGSASGGSGGNIQAYGDQFYVENANAITASAVAGNGNGGTITLNNNDLYFEEADATLAVNGSGTGNGGSLNIQENDSMENLGGSLSAKGGSTSGNGGSISLNIYNDLNFEAANSTLSANGGATGNGGSVYMNSSSLEFAGTESSISANAGTTSGNGGTVTVYSYSDLSLGNGGPNAVFLSATAPGTANTTANNGGSIDVEYESSLTVNGSNVSVAAGGNANGGTINFSQLGQLTLTGTLSADGSGTGNAGSITLAPTSNIMTLDSSTISVSGASNGNGNGNELSIDNGSSPISMTGTTVMANGGGTGNGGNVDINTTDDITDGSVMADGGCNDGVGGTITINANDVSFEGIEAGNKDSTICGAVAAAPSKTAHPISAPTTGKTTTGMVHKSVKRDMQPSSKRPRALLPGNSFAKPMPGRAFVIPVPKASSANKPVRTLADANVPGVTVNANDWDLSRLAKGAVAPAMAGQLTLRIRIRSILLPLRCLDSLSSPPGVVRAVQVVR